MEEILLDLIILLPVAIFVIIFWVLMIKLVSKSSGGLNNAIKTIGNMFSRMIDEYNSENKNSSDNHKINSSTSTEVRNDNQNRKLFEKESNFNGIYSGKDNNPFEV